MAPRAGNAEAVTQEVLAPMRKAAYTLAARIPLLSRSGDVREYAIVDDDMADELGTFRWSFSNGYAWRPVYVGDGIFMHRFLLGLDRANPLEADHINGNGLDNRRVNLRRATRLENANNLRCHRARRDHGISEPIIVRTLPSPRSKRGDPNKGRFLAVLGEEKAAEILRRRRSGERGKDLAAEFGVSQQLICDILKGRRYPAIGLADR